MFDWFRKGAGAALFAVLLGFVAIGCTRRRGAFVAPPECPKVKEPKVSAWFASQPSSQVVDYMNLDGGELARQQGLAEAGLLSVAPVLLPEPGTPGGDLLREGSDRHFGWPVAAMVDDVIVVAFKVAGRGEHVVRSLDAGRTWQAPVALARFRQHRDAWGPGMIALGASSEGTFILACSMGVFASEDGGETWTHRDCRLGAKPHAGNAGPRILDHPRYGLVLPYHRFRDETGGSFRLCFFVSKDGGRRWDEVAPAVAEGLAPAEPTVFAWNESMAVLSRNHSGYPQVPGQEVGYLWRWNYMAQFVPQEPSATSDRLGEVVFDGRLTNIYARRMDTLDVDFNPISGRIEAVVSKRNEGFPYADNGRQTLSLWSIDPESFFRRHEAQWRFDGVLLRLGDAFSGTPGPSNPPRDGLHPGGSVIDRKRGLQHIFVYSGASSHIYGHGQSPKPRNPADSATGLFRITRTLETDRLRQAILPRGGSDGAPGLEETFADTTGWTPSGRPIALRVTDNKDIVERIVGPLPGPLPQAGPRGLRWETAEPGHYGLYNETAVVPDRYRLTFRAKIERYAPGADTLGVSVVRGAIKHYLVLRDDGVYEWTDPEQSPKRVRRLDMDGRWHEWTMEADRHGAVVYLDDVEVARLQPMIEAVPGRDDAPLGLFIHTTEASGPTAVRISRLVFEPLDDPEERTRDKR